MFTNVDTLGTDQVEDRPVLPVRSVALPTWIFDAHHTGLFAVRPAAFFASLDWRFSAESHVDCVCAF